MLCERLKKQGVDVVIGIVETHDRAETQEQIGDLEIVPPRIIEYRGVKLREMDLDAILAGAPRTEIAGVMTPSPYKQGDADPSRVGGWIQARRAVEKSTGRSRGRIRKARAQVHRCQLALALVGDPGLDKIG